MNTAYCATIRDETLNVDLIPYFECEISASWDDGFYSVDAVYLDGKNLFEGDQHSQWIAHRVADAANADFQTPGTRLSEMATDQFGRAA